MSSFFQVSEVELIYRSKVKASDRPQIMSSRTAFDIFLYNWSDQIEIQEEFNILLLNQANRVIGFYNVSKGGRASTVVDAKVVFAAALKGNAVSLVLAHNHPSYSLIPSLQDIKLTKKLVAGAKLLDLKILDHLIITPVDYYSFADEGKLE
jgi:DNA repair protein RadC